MNIQRVPAYLEVDGKKLEIGTGLVDNDMRCVEISVDPNLSSMLRDKIGVSIGDVSIECAKHKPRQHRDAKPPWCDACGLTAEFKKPVSFLEKRRIDESSTDHDFTD